MLAGEAGLSFVQPWSDPRLQNAQPQGPYWLAPTFSHYLMLEGFAAAPDPIQPQIVDLMLPHDMVHVVRDLCRLARFRVDAPRPIGPLGGWSLPLWTGDLLIPELEPSDLPVFARWLRQVIVDRRAPAFVAFELSSYLDERR